MDKLEEEGGGWGWTIFFEDFEIKNDFFQFSKIIYLKWFKKIKQKKNSNLTPPPLPGLGGGGGGFVCKDTEGSPPLPLVKQMAVRCLWLQSVRI